jgi:hypothetical protein
MEDLMKQDIFFFITSIAVVVLTALVATAFYYILKILNDIKYIANKAKTESDLLAEDLHELRSNVKTEGAKLKHFASFFTSIYKRNKR